ncbi:MAG TPA: hypothetical protein VJU52_14060 [Flavobacterium sp.]|nr:hypothetical protein [Flavobacterium sp.]
MKKILLLFLLFSLNSFAQEFHEGTVNYLNGDTKKGLIKLKGDYLKFKENEDAKTVKIDDSLLKSIMFESIDGKKYILERVFRQAAFKKFKYCWLQLLQEGGYYSLYLTADGYSYSFDQYGNMQLTSSYINNRTLPCFTYYIKKFDEDKVYYFSPTSGLNAEYLFRDSCREFLSDYPELLARVEKKELKKMNVDYVIDQYNKFKKKKEIVKTTPIKSKRK